MKSTSKLSTALADKWRTLVMHWKSLSRKQKTLRIVGIIVLFAIILVIVDWYSPRTIIGIDRTIITKTINNENLYDAGLFTDTTLSKSASSGAVVTVHYPTTNNKALDEYISNAASDFAASVAQTATTDITYIQNSFVNGSKVFVTFSTPTPIETKTPIKTIGFTKKGPLGAIFANDDYKNTVIQYVSSKMNTDFQVQNELSTKLTEQALAAGDYRLASNGLVVQLPTAKLPAGIAGVGYYEVLVPTSVIQKYLAD